MAAMTTAVQGAPVKPLQGPGEIRSAALAATHRMKAIRLAVATDRA